VLAGERGGVASSWGGCSGVEESGLGLDGRGSGSEGRGSRSGVVLEAEARTRAASAEMLVGW